ncbi:copper amine oxidase N-terminal domain-containing protein [Tumebacillus sp. ITR2]|uniref:Copper amine oxidase N-terminal domain-containing protein n=1 Tax=Tumebacillus amylolyticus TaxID=2801339 RepID=A0ABS1J733_9BACL|nr:copper amine oxidase N-terminal domain-containing protein [Tumebacillus amylolyticus]MBL0385483.1 copper amine oxidase N-terminal domain-containing protein [Tumebacillus amylolyticus]
MTLWKRWTQTLLLGVCVAGGLGVAQAASAATPERPDVYVDGEWIRFDVQPQAFQYRTLVPMRMIFEALGADVRWEEATQTAVATKDGVTLRLPIGSTRVTKNGVAMPIDVPAQLVKDRTMVPVRFVAESFGDEVLWNEALGRVTINSVNAPKIRVVGDDALLKDGMTANLQSLVRRNDLTTLVENEIGKTFKKPVWVYLANSAKGFEQNIAKYGGDRNAKSMAETAEGVTYGSHVLIPLNKLPNDGELTQTVSHELMHVLLNQNGGLSLPSWVHEGLAWQTGLDAQFKSQPAVMRRQMDGMLRDYVLGVVEQGKYQPLLSSQDGTIDALTTAGYNVELQDYLAYQYYVATYGKTKFLSYLNAYVSGGTHAFESATGVTEAAFEADYRAYLDREVKRTSNGMEITLNVPANFQGVVQLLPQGTGKTSTDALVLQPGLQKIRVYKDGHVEGVQTRPTNDRSDREQSAVYLFVDVNQAVKEQGVSTESGGMGFYDSYGEYYYGYAWLETEQDAVYPDTNRVLGLEILDVHAF